MTTTPAAGRVRVAAGCPIGGAVPSGIAGARMSNVGKAANAATLLPPAGERP
jgi:hypothetical protein